MNKWREPIKVVYLKDRVCSCDKFEYEDGFNWDRCFQAMTSPPTCKNCGKWMNRVHTCTHCRQQYYQFFQHPLMSHEASIEKIPWECWDCLETWVRWVPCKGREKIPPPAAILIPDREPQVMEHSDSYNDALAFLASL